MALLVLLTIIGSAAAGCRARRATSPEGVGIGFSLDDNALVERGAIVTQPGGREEAFLVFVAGGAPLWLESCRNEAGGSPVIFSFTTDDGGRPRAVSQPATAPARARCAAAQAAAAPAATSLPPRTEVTVQVTLRTSN